MTMTMLEFELPDYMRRSLDHSGLGVAEIAARLDVSRATVGRWINGHTKPTTAVLMAWAQLTGVDYEWLAGAKYTPRDLNPEPTD